MSTLLTLVALASEATATVAAAAAHSAADSAGHAASHAAHPSFLGLDSKGWVAVGTLLFVGLIVYLKAPAAIAGALDGRIAKIKAELDQAANLRAEAEALRKGYEKKLADAERQANAILEHAKEEADAMVAEAKTQLSAVTKRRKAAAESKISAAERSAVEAIRDNAARMGAAAAAKLMADKLSSAEQGRLVDEALVELDRRLH